MASIWDTLFPNQDYRTAAPSGGYADLYANGLLGNRTDTPTSVGAMETGKDFIPGIGDAIALKEAYDAASRGDKVAAGLLTASAALGLIPFAGDAVARPVMAAGRKAADVASRIEVDPNAVGSMLGNVRMKPKADAPFDAGGTFGHNGGPFLDTRVPYTRSGSDIAEYLAEIPSAKSVAGVKDTAPGGMFTTVTAQQPNILSDHTSQGFLSDELIAPTPTSIADYMGRDLMSIVGDNTGRHTVTGQGGKMFETPVDSMAGFQYTDVEGQGYAGARSATSSKFNEALDRNDPAYISLLMGERSGDFSQHVNDIYAQMFRNSSIDASDIPKVDSAIRGIGMSKTVKVLDDAGKPVLKKDGSAKTKSVTVYPFQDFSSASDPAALGNYILQLPSGSQRAALIKGLDRAGLHKMGVPKVADARLAAADPDQIGMDWGTTGYRIITPDLQKGLLDTTPLQSTTYDTGIDKVGNSETLLGNGSRGIPASLTFRDLNEAMVEKGTGGGLLMNSPMYKVLESSPKRAVQPVDDMLVETIDTFMEIENRFGREGALKYADQLSSAGKITSQVIDAARKANAPKWMIAAMASSAGLSSNYGQMGEKTNNNSM
tara:strand:- start:102 stop:1907 length:1806 start_codon:yes stop_codon:yes gene_type:complete